MNTVPGDLEKASVPLFGDVNRLVYDRERDEMRAMLQISPQEVERLLAAIAAWYSKSKKKRSVRITALAAELGRLIADDSFFFAECSALIALGNIVELDSKRISPDVFTLSTIKE